MEISVLSTYLLSSNLCVSCVSSLLLKSTGSFPSPWKNSVILVPKTSPLLLLPQICPNSLLNHVFKLLEKSISDILLDHLFSSNILSDSQFDVLPSHSTSSALAAANQHISFGFSSISLTGYNVSFLVMLFLLPLLYSLVFPKVPF